MDNSELQTLLAAGVAAVKRRDLAQGRALLLKVVENDDQQELAWLWLSLAVQAPSDKEIALENVLTINPDNAAARKRLGRLKRAPESRAAGVAQPRSILTNDNYLAGAPADVDDSLDDPYQCAYCGKITGADDKVCAHCGKNLYDVLPKEAMTEFLRTAIMLTGVSAIVGVVEVVTPFLALIYKQTGDPAYEVLLQVPGAELVLGNILQPAYTIAIAQTLIVAWLVRSGLLVGLLLGMRLRWSPVYYIGLTLYILDLVVNLGLLVTGYLSGVACLLNLGLGVAGLFLLAGADHEFAVVEARLWTQPDGKAHNAGDFYWRGLAYSRKGRWALAVAQWRKAVGLAPKERLYAKDLGIGYAQIGRFDRSLRILEEVQRQAPGDPQIDKLLALVREQMKRSGKGA